MGLQFLFGRNSPKIALMIPANAQNDVTTKTADHTG